MKNPVRNVVVEYKNKRSRKGNGSLWGNLDLKTIAREVAADTLPASAVAREGADFTSPPDNEAKRNDTKIVKKQMAPVEANEVDIRALVVDKVDPEQAMITPDPLHEPIIREGTVSRKKNPSPPRNLRTGELRNTQTRAAAFTDIQRELWFLEQENASLKRQLIAKLRQENEDMVAMLERAEQRTTQYRG